MYDVIIVGAGPAGLSAALILGRCRRRVLVCDNNQPRNSVTESVHGFFSRDGVNPIELRHIGREQLKPYATIELRDATVVDAFFQDSGFEVILANGLHQQSRRLLLATGVVDNLPDIKGLSEVYGKGVFHCPYCDGFEVGNQPIAAYGKGKNGYGLALELTAWSNDIALCTDGEAGLDQNETERLDRLGIRTFEERIERFTADGNGRLESIVFSSGSILQRAAVFLSTGNRQRSHLPEKLGCIVSPKGDVVTGKHEKTNVPGLYVAGDASKDVQLVVIAAAEGAKAAFDINTDLTKEDLARRETAITRNEKETLWR